MKRSLILMAISLACSGCAAKTVFDLATMPVKTTRDAVGAGSKTVDLLTTSQGEADRHRGRQIRKAEQRLTRLEHRYRDQSEDCEDSDEDACRKRIETWDEIKALRPYVPQRQY